MCPLIVLSKNFINDANRVQYDKIKVFSIRRFASLSVDAGTVNGISYLTIILCNTSLKSIVLRNCRYFKGKTINYCEEIGKEIDHLKNQYNIFITGIVGDNQKAQKSAIDPNSKKSLQYKSLDCNVKAIVYCPCMCHSVSLALKDFILENDIFNEMISNLRTVSEILKSKNITNIIFKVCPSYCVTRWTILFDIAHWIVVHFKLL